MDIMLTRGTKKLLVTAALLLGILYLLYSRGSIPGRDCPKTESMSKKTSMISQDGTLYEYDRQSPLIFIGGVPRYVPTPLPLLHFQEKLKILSIETSRLTAVIATLYYVRFLKITLIGAGPLS